MNDFKKIRESIISNPQFDYVSSDDGLLETLKDSPLRKDIFDLHEIINDKPCLNAAKQYKTNITIRRDLRMAYDICNYAINLQAQINQNYSLLEKDMFHVYLTAAAVMNSIVIYARWFLPTNGKTTLTKETFFLRNSAEEKTHLELMNIRMKYIAHYEEDLLGSDRICAYFNEAGKFIKTDSDWFIRLFPELPSFKVCIEIVHNKIDADILPEKQKKLDEQLKRIYGSS